MPMPPIALDLGPLLPHLLEELLIWGAVGLVAIGLVTWLVRGEMKTRRNRALIEANRRFALENRAHPENRWEPDGWVTPDTEPAPSPEPHHSPAEPQQSPYDQPPR